MGKNVPEGRHQVEDLDYWDFIDYALGSESTARLGIDGDAARLFMTLNRATRLLFYDLQSTVRGTEVSEAGFSLLFVLFQTGKISMSKLTQLIHMSKASVSAAVRTLTAQGLVGRERSENDARSLNLEITPAGRRVVESIYPHYNEREQAWANLLSEHDRAELLRILTVLTAGARADAEATDDEPTGPQTL